MTSDDNLAQLVDNIVSEPFTRMPEQTDESVIPDMNFFKYPLISCELLINDQLQAIVADKLVSSATLMDKLYAFLKRDYINPVLMSYYVKVIGSIITKKPQQFLDYIESRDVEFVELFVKHINISSIVDILRLLVTISDRNRAVDWLKKIGLIETLVKQFAAANAPRLNQRVVASVYSNVSQALCDLVKITREYILNVLCGLDSVACSGGGGVSGLGLTGAVTGLGIPGGFDDFNAVAPFQMDHDDTPRKDVANRPGSNMTIQDVAALVNKSILEHIER